LLSTIADHDITIKNFLLVSSQAAVGPSPSQEPVIEDYPCQPLTQYGKSKWQTEQIALSFREKLPVTIVRPCAVYGPRDTDVLNLFRTLKYGFNLMVGSVDQLVNVVYVEDCAEGIIQATFSKNTAGKTYFICEDTPYYWSEFAAIAGDIMNKKYLTLKLPYPLVNLIAYFIEGIARVTGGMTILNQEKMLEVRESFWCVSPARAQKDFNYQTHFSAEKGIERTIRWYKENSWL
jgi:nucleoside-diphosphate-sugar epimerase